MLAIILLVLLIILIHSVIGFLCSVYFISHPDCFVWDAGNGIQAKPRLNEAIGMGNIWICLIIYFIIYKSAKLYTALVRYFANKIINKEKK